MASVRKREWVHKGAAKTAWVLDYVDQSGKRRLKTFDKKKDADAFRQQVEAEINAGVHTASRATVTLRACAEDYIKELDRKRRLGDMTGGGVKGASQRVDMVVKAIGHLKVTEVTEPVVAEMIAKMRGTYAASTVIGAYSGLSMLLAFAIKRKWLKRNVAIDEPVLLPKRKKRTAIPSKADIQTLLDASATRGHWENVRPFLNRRLLICLGVFGGLRPGEISGLSWEDIDWAKSEINVRHNLSRFDGLKVPKTIAGVRSVPLTAPVKDALNALQRYERICSIASMPDKGRSLTRDAVRERVRVMFEADELVVFGKTSLSGLILQTRYGTPVSADKSNKEYFYRTMKAAGLFDDKADRPTFTLHALRHAAASLFIEHGLPALNLKTVMGHSSVSTTYDVYGHLFPEDQRTSQAAVAIAAAFSATSQQHGRPSG